MPSKNIIVVSGPSLAASRSRRGGTDKNYSLWGGGSTTVVSPDGSNGDVILAELECVPSVVKYKVNTENTNILSPTSLWGPVKINSALNTPNCGSQERRLIVTDLLSPSTQALLTSL